MENNNKNDILKFSGTDEIILIFNKNKKKTKKT